MDSVVVNFTVKIPKSRALGKKKRKEKLTRQTGGLDECEPPELATRLPGLLPPAVRASLGANTLHVHTAAG